MRPSPKQTAEATYTLFSFRLRLRHSEALPHEPDDANEEEDDGDADAETDAEADAEGDFVGGGEGGVGWSGGVQVGEGGGVFGVCGDVEEVGGDGGVAVPGVEVEDGWDGGLEEVGVAGTRVSGVDRWDAVGGEPYVSTSQGMVMFVSLFFFSGDG